MLAFRVAVIALSAAIAIVSIARGHVVLGALLLALVVARVAMLATMMRRRGMRRELRERRRERVSTMRGNRLR
jgi:hypothetical protein